MVLQNDFFDVFDFFDEFLDEFFDFFKVAIGDRAIFNIWRGLKIQFYAG